MTGLERAFFVAFPSKFRNDLDGIHPNYELSELGKRVTIADVARRAGVSTATVDRVISNRRRVRPTTTEAVTAAARELNFYATTLLQHRSAELTEQRTLGFVLQKRSKRFYRRLEEALKMHASKMNAFNCEVRIKFVDELSALAIVGAMAKLAGEVDAMAAVALEHPYVNDEVKRLRLAGIPMVALLSGISSPDLAGFIGTDGRKAGRCAAWAIEKCARAGSSVGIMIGSHRYASHEDREGGLRSYFREHRSNFDLPPAITYFDNDEGAYECALELLEKQPGIGAIYTIGGGAKGAIRAIREDGRANQVTLACHELNSDTRDALIDGTACMVIDTPINKIAKTAVRTLSEFRSSDPVLGKSEILPFRIYLSENV